MGVALSLLFSGELFRGVGDKAAPLSDSVLLCMSGHTKKYIHGLNCGLIVLLSSAARLHSSG